MDDSEFTQNKMNVIKMWDTEKTGEEFGLLAIRTVWDKSGRENRKLTVVQLEKKPFQYGISKRLCYSGVFCMTIGTAR